MENSVSFSVPKKSFGQKIVTGILVAISLAVLVVVTLAMLQLIFS